MFLVVIAVRDFGDADNVGWLQGAMGVGTIVGGVMILSRVAKGRLAQDMVIGVLGWSVPIIALALFPSPVTAIAALVVIGIADPWVNLGLETIPQRLAPSHAISRVYAAVESIAIAAMALGSLIAPLLIHLFGTQRLAGGSRRVGHGVRRQHAAPAAPARQATHRARGPRCPGHGADLRAPAAVGARGDGAPAGVAHLRRPARPSSARATSPTGST